MSRQPDFIMKQQSKAKILIKYQKGNWNPHAARLSNENLNHRFSPLKKYHKNYSISANLTLKRPVNFITLIQPHIYHL